MLNLVTDQSVGTYYWYMYLLDFDNMVIPGLKKVSNDSPKPEGFMVKEKAGDIEASAESSKRASIVGVGA
jgi:hypothetical protein